MGLVGENGAGKTTLIKLILNLIRRDAGRITIFGKDAIQAEQDIKRDIGVVFDECSFPTAFTTAQTATFLRGIYPTWDGGLFQRLCQQFALPADKKTVKDFSRGTKMKLSIAAALAHHPRLLILDEATAGLDPIVRNEVLDLLLDFIQNEECSILLSSHITADLDQIADYFAFLHNGQLMFCQPKDALLANYGILRCGTAELEQISSDDILFYRKNSFNCEALTHKKSEVRRRYPNMVLDPASLEDIMLFYAKGKRK